MSCVWQNSAVSAVQSESSRVRLTVKCSALQCNTSACDKVDRRVGEWVSE